MGEDQVISLHIICCAFFPSVGCQIRTAIRQVIGPSEQETENSPCCEVEGRKYFSKKRKYPDAIVAGHGKKRGKVTQCNYVRGRECWHSTDSYPVANHEF